MANNEFRGVWMVTFHVGLGIKELPVICHDSLFIYNITSSTLAFSKTSTIHAMGSYSILISEFSKQIPIILAVITLCWHEKQKCIGDSFVFIAICFHFELFKVGAFDHMVNILGSYVLWERLSH